MKHEYAIGVNELAGLFACVFVVFVLLLVFFTGTCCYWHRNYVYMLLIGSRKESVAV